MPRVKSHSRNAKSLFKSCVDFVALNLDHWCNSLENERGRCNQKVTFSPFDKLPSMVLEDINLKVFEKVDRYVLDKMKIKKQFLELLITPHLRSLDMSVCQSKDVSYIFNLASMRCPYLNTARLVLPSHCEIFVHLCALKFESLQVLDISWTDVEDSCLQILGMYCKDLRELNLEYCKKVTDVGIEGLCVSVDHFGKEDGTTGTCKSLESLYIGYTKITKKGIQTALENLPFLKLLKESPRSYNHTVTVQILAEMHQLDFQTKNQKDICKYSLINLNLIEWSQTSNPTSIPYISGSLGLVASLCPSVTSVEIELITGLTDNDLLDLLFLKNIKELKISETSAENIMVTFKGSVVPLLKGLGSSLQVLQLSYLHDVNVRAIIDFCPKLQSLTLDENQSYYSNAVEPNDSKRGKMEPLLPSVLKYLEKLNVICFNRDEGAEEKEIISSEDLLSLFSSPSLIKIDISACDTLTDYVFERASKIHQFLCLECLSINICHCLTRKGIDVVMNKKTPLNTIVINICNNFRNDDNAWLISKIESEKWQLSFIYDEMDVD